MGRFATIARVHSDRPTHNFTTLLNDAGSGDAAALERVWRAIHDDIHTMAARACHSETGRIQLQPTLLVNELFLKMFGPGVVHTIWDDRRHFWGSVGRALSQFLVDQARSEGRVRRGGGRQRIPLSIAAGELADPDRAMSPEAVAAIEALAALEQVNAEAAEVARLRFLAGFSVEQTATLLDIAPRTVSKRWSYAKAWLRRAMVDPQ